MAALTAKIDMSHWPAAVVALKGEANTGQDMAEVIETLLWVRGRNPQRLIIDMSNMGGRPQAIARKALAEHLTEHWSGIPIPFVCASPLLRGAVTAMQWVMAAAPSPPDIKICVSTNDALSV